MTNPGSAAGIRQSLNRDTTGPDRCQPTITCFLSLASLTLEWLMLRAKPSSTKDAGLARNAVCFIAPARVSNGISLKQREILFVPITGHLKSCGLWREIWPDDRIAMSLGILRPDLRIFGNGKSAGSESNNALGRRPFVLAVRSATGPWFIGQVSKSG
jgi:hypothetical protein